MRKDHRNAGASVTSVGIILLMLLLPWQIASAETALGVYFGLAFALPGDVSISHKESRDIYHQVAWFDESFVSPVYYSIRLMYWPRSDSQNGLTLDFTHAKLYSDLHQTVAVTHIDSDGQHQTYQPLGKTFSRLAFSHGYNLLTLNAVHRSPARHHDSFNDASVYFGAGAGITVPHVEVYLIDNRTDRYLPTGLVFQVITGLTLGSQRGVPVNAEYKFSMGNARATLSDGSQLTFRPRLQHFSIGPVYRANH